MKRLIARCADCERVFDLTDETDAEEFSYGHDCESRVGQLRRDLDVLDRMRDGASGVKFRAQIARDTVRITNELNTILAGAF